MRIDKFLWSIRFYKTRSIAADEIKKNKVSLGGNVVKSSKEVKEGDVLKIKKNQIEYQIKILQVPKSRIGPKLVPLHIEVRLGCLPRNPNGKIDRKLLASEMADREF